MVETSQLPSSIAQDYSLYTAAMVYEVIVINTVTRENMLWSGGKAHCAAMLDLFKE